MRESQSAFGVGRVLIEKFIPSPRHIEIQVFADGHGHVVHLGERDCSLQRRHQKVIEEAPAPGMTPALRAQMGAVAIAAAKAVGYRGAGTVEFVADGTRGLRADGFWFIEMNTRLQVEHPVTEEITGLDLVEWQFRIAAGESLPLTQNQIRLDGHAIEARVYAEDPEHGFLPSTGKIVALELPKNIRVDSGVEKGAEVTPFYDAMIAKLIARGATREAALEQLDKALETTLIVGLRSNVAFLANLCRSDAFRRGAVDTGFIDRSLAILSALPHERDAAAAALGITHLLNTAAARSAVTDEHELSYGDSPWSERDGFQLNGPRTVALPVVIDGEDANAVVTFAGDGPRVAVDGVSAASDARAFAAGEDVFVLRGGRQTHVRIKDFSETATDLQTGDSVIKAPMHGRVMEIFAAAGDRVAFGQRLAVIEAMKMEHTLRAPFAAVVTEVPVSSGAQVVEGAPIMVLERVEDLIER